MKFVSQFVAATCLLSLSLPALAAPSGHMRCETTSRGKSIVFTYGIEASTGDGDLKVDGKETALSDDVHYISAQSALDGRDSRNAAAIHIATAQDNYGIFVELIESTGPTKTPFLLTVNTDQVAFVNKPVTCKVLDSRLGNEQN